MKIAVTGGYNQSDHTISLIHLLVQEDVEINMVLIVKITSYKRIRSYYLQLDFKEFLKKVVDRVLGKFIPLERSKESTFISDFKKAKGINFSTVSSICGHYCIPYHFVSSLNLEKSLSLVNNFDLGIYSGGGIVFTKFISQFKIGLLNCHAGLLPEIRGMNSSEWSVLLGTPQCNTLHFIVREIDQGPILFKYTHDYSECRSVNELRGKAIITAINDLVKTVLKIKNGDFALTQQRKEDGRQYYVMHRILRNLVEHKLNESDKIF